MTKQDNSKPRETSGPAPSGEGIISHALASVGNTVELFAGRMKRKLIEKQNENELTKKAADERHALILKALTTIRKALQATSKLSLSTRFHLELHI